MAKLGIRQFGKELGLKDEDITYNNGSVYFKGKHFMDATPEADGSTYSTRNNLETAYKGYMGKTMMDKYTNEMTNNRPAPVKVEPYKPLEMQGLMNNPAYQTGLQAQMQAAANQQGNQYAQMRAQGRGKSSYADAVTSQIGNQAMVDYNARMVPQLMQQDYDQYYKNADLGLRVDDMNHTRNRQYAGDIRTLAGDYQGMYQNDIAQQEARRAANIKNAMDLGKEYGFGVLPKDSGEELFRQVEGRQTLESQKQQDQYMMDAIKTALSVSEKVGYVTPDLSALTGLPVGSSTQAAKEFIAELGVKEYTAQSGRISANASATSASASAANASLSRERLAWEKDNNNPDNILKNAQASKASREQSESVDPMKYVNTLSSMYVQKDPYTGELKVNNPEALKNAIIMMNLDDNATDQLLTFYGIPIKQ